MRHPHPSLVTLALLVALLVGACSGSDDGPPLDGDASDAAPRTTVAQCLQQRGWTVTIHEDGYESEVPRDQAERYDADRAGCTDLYEEAPRDVSTITDEEFAQQYEAELEVRDCLREQGAPTTEPPSLQAYIEAYRSGTPAWSGSEALSPAELGRERFEELQELCPPTFVI